MQLLSEGHLLNQNISLDLEALRHPGGYYGFRNAVFFQCLPQCVAWGLLKDLGAFKILRIASWSFFLGSHRELLGRPGPDHLKEIGKSRYGNRERNHQQGDYCRQYCPADALTASEM